MKTRQALILTLMILLPSFSLAKDGWTSKKIPEPAKATVIATHHKEMVGDAITKSYRSGDSGISVWAHLHGLHRGRLGKTKLGAMVLLTDPNNKIVWKSDVVGVSIGGRLFSSEAHKHRYGKWIVTGDALAAHAAGIKLKPLIVVTRVRSDDISKEVSDLAMKLVSEYAKKKLTN